MARIRALKPDFFKDEDLATLPYEARLLYQGLWCFADKEGRLEDRPKYLKAEIFPYDNINIEKLLNLLCNPNIQDRSKKVFIRRYTVNERKYIDIPEFLKHQSPHHTEKESVFPSFNGELTVIGTLKKNDRRDAHISYPISKSLSESKSLLKNKFEIFYKSYPKKKAKIEAEKAFSKLNPDDTLLNAMLSAIDKAKKSEDWMKDKGRYIPYPATWINAKRWLDEETESHPLAGTISDKTIRTVEILDDWRPPA
jgi:hypothetical protein